MNIQSHPETTRCPNHSNSASSSNFVSSSNSLTSDVVSLLQRLQGMGCHLAADGDKLRIRAPKNTLTPAIKAEIQSHKPALFKLRQTVAQAAQDPQSLENGLAPISTDRPDAPLPLSLAQQRLWFLAQLDKNVATYHIPRAVQLDGVININALDDAIAHLTHRHEILRTTFPTVDGIAIQQIHTTVHIPLQVINASELSVPLSRWLTQTASPTTL